MIFLTSNLRIQFQIIIMSIKAGYTDEQVFYDKFLCDKFYLLVCTRNFDK
jgi:hypothetical protein